MLKMASSIKIITQINLSYVLIRKSFIKSFELVTAFFFFFRFLEPSKGEKQSL